MADFNVRSDSVDVEQIMEQIRGRIREKRGVDYTEQQIRELATVKLEKLIDPRVRSDLVEQFRHRRPAVYEPLVLPELPEHALQYFLQHLSAFVPERMSPYVVEDVPESLMYTFEAETIYETHRGLLRFVRRLLNPILKLLFNPNPIIQALHRQGNLNRLILDRDRQIVERDRQIIDRDAQLVERDKQIVERDKQLVDAHKLIAERDRLIVERDNVRESQRVERREMDALYYEVIHNLVFELTRLGIENKNLKMRVESIASRLEFNERRARALESVVVYKPSEDAESAREPAPSPGAQPAARPQGQTGPPLSAGAVQPVSTGPGQGGAPGPEGPGQRSRRRRRRRGRRGGAPAFTVMGGAAQAASAGSGPSDVVARDAATDPGVTPSASTGGAAEERPEAAPAPESTGSDPDTDEQ